MILPQEKKVLDLTGDLWNEFMQLYPQHPSEQQDVCNAIHVIQNKIAMRLAQREHPEIFPIPE